MAGSARTTAKGRYGFPEPPGFAEAQLIAEPAKEDGAERDALRDVADFVVSRVR